MKKKLEDFIILFIALTSGVTITALYGAVLMLPVFLYFAGLKLLAFIVGIVYFILAIKFLLKEEE